jgi:putative Mn2+ efflux pump MntP
MKALILFGIAVALAVDAMAVTIGLACYLNGLKRSQTVRLALHFGMFQFGMPVIGWFIGENLLKLVSDYDHWVAFGLLLVIGLRMIRESFKEEEERFKAQDPTRGWPLVVLALATSQDALATGLSLSVLGINIWLASTVIGLTAFSLTVVASRLGPLLGKVFGRRAEIAGGLILILIGLKILVDHLG